MLVLFSINLCLFKFVAFAFLETHTQSCDPNTKSWWKLVPDKCKVQTLMEIERVTGLNDILELSEKCLVDYATIHLQISLLS